MLKSKAPSKVVMHCCEVKEDVLFRVLRAVFGKFDNQQNVILLISFQATYLFRSLKQSEFALAAQMIVAAALCELVSGRLSAISTNLLHVAVWSISSWISLPEKTKQAAIRRAIVGNSKAIALPVR